MTRQEQDAELGSLLRERASVKQTLACLKSKLAKTAAAYRMAAVALDNERAEWQLQKTEGGLVVPISQEWGADAHVIPELDDVIRWIEARENAKRRLDEINEILPD